MFKWIWKNLDWIANLIEHSLVVFMYGWIYLCMGWVLPGHFLIFQFAFWFPVAVNRGTQGKTKDCILWINGGYSTFGNWWNLSSLFSHSVFIDTLFFNPILRWLSRLCSQNVTRMQQSLCSFWKLFSLEIYTSEINICSIRLLQEMRQMVLNVAGSDQDPVIVSG